MVVLVKHKAVIRAYFLKGLQRENCSFPIRSFPHSNVLDGIRRQARKNILVFFTPHVIEINTSLSNSMGRIERQPKVVLDK